MPSARAATGGSDRHADTAVKTLAARPADAQARAVCSDHGNAGVAGHRDKPDRHAYGPHTHY
jgi:hypothetical protein